MSYAEGRIRKMRHIFDEREWTLPGRVCKAREEIENGNLPEILDAAKTDPDAFDVLHEICAYSVERGEKLPTELQIYAARVLRGELTRPKAKAGRPSGKSGKQRALWQLVRDIVKHSELNPGRSESKAGGSASDAVADVMRRAGLQPNSYGNVRKAYEAENRRVRDDDQAFVSVEKG